jgi:glycosyltransferase involved in cell wall biosynthesis
VNEHPDQSPAPPLRVLYVHHAAVFGGASRSLMELIAAFPPGSVVPRVIVPHGVVADLLTKAGIEVLQARGITQLDCTRYGHYRGVRWLILLREIFYLPFTLRTLCRARRRWPDIDLVHINDTTQAICIALAGRIFRAPVIVHARALLAGELIPRRMRWLGRLLAQRAHAVIAIDETVRSPLPPAIDADVIHNGFAPGLRPRTAPPPELAKLPAHGLKVAMVGSLSPMKGAYEFIEAARILAARGVDVHFILVGDDIRPVEGLRGWLLRALGFGRPVRLELERFVATHGLGGRVHFIGFTTEIKAVYDAIDVICFPSHLDAPGRPVFEAAFSGVPSIVAMRDPRPDTMIDGETGICIPARDAQALAAAIEQLDRDRSGLRRMGEHARALALRNFDIRRNATEVLAVYRRVLAKFALDQTT